MQKGQPGQSGFSKKDLKKLMTGAKGLMEDLKEEDMTIKKVFQIMKELSLGMELMNRKLDILGKNQGVDFTEMR